MARAYPDKPIHLACTTFANSKDLAACVERAVEQGLTFERYIFLLRVHLQQTVEMEHFHA